MGQFYPKPGGYNTAVKAGASKYLPNNGYLSGGGLSYAPWRPLAEILRLTFGAAPADGSTIKIPDGVYNAPNTPLVTFTFVWNGAPGAGIIPLVAGGGTAAQAATATQTALAAQLTKWTIGNPSSGVATLLSRQPGLIIPTSYIVLTGTTNITVAITQSAALAQTLPGRAGRSGAILGG